MNDIPFSSGVPVPPRYPWWHWRRLGFNFLTISIAAHLLFGVGATYLIVQTIQAQRKQTFAGPPSSPNAPTRALEHKVQMQKKQATMSAPAPVKRITTTSNSRVALPAMPALPKLDSQVVPVAMAGMGGTGVGLGLGSGGGGGGGGNGGGLSVFGFHGGKGLIGSFYDLKQTAARQPTPIDNVEKFVRELNLFLSGGWNESFLRKYFRAPVSLTASLIFVPLLPSAEAPKAFGVQNEVKPSLWMALYKGQVSPPESGTYHFVGGGDNILIVRFNGSIVLDRSWNYQEKFGIDRSWKSVADYDYKFGSVPRGFAKGQSLELEAGKFYDMQILLGDDGGVTHFSLLVEKEGEQYGKTAGGLPLLPLFRTSPDPPPQGTHPPFQSGGPIWKVRNETPL